VKCPTRGVGEDRATGMGYGNCGKLGKKQLRRVFHSSHSPYCYLYLRKKNKEEKTLLWKV
jgi:hypothetical protein